MESIEEQAARIAAGRNDCNDSQTKEERDAAAWLTALSLLSEGRTVTATAKQVGLDRTTLFRWSRKTPESIAVYEAAKVAGEDARKADIECSKYELGPKALRVLHDAMDGKLTTREALTAAIFSAKTTLGMVETSRVENVDIVPIIDDIPDV